MDFQGDIVIGPTNNDADIQEVQDEDLDVCESVGKFLKSISSDIPLEPLDAAVRKELLASFASFGEDTNMDDLIRIVTASFSCLAKKLGLQSRLLRPNVRPQCRIWCLRRGTRGENHQHFTRFDHPPAAI